MDDLDDSFADGLARNTFSDDHPTEPAQKKLKQDKKEDSGVETKTENTVPALSERASSEKLNVEEAAPASKDQVERKPGSDTIAVPEKPATVVAEGGKTKRSAGANESKEKKVDPRTVFVGGLSYSIDADQLELDFGEHGVVDHLNLVRWKGFALITYAAESGAQNALKLDGDEYWGRTIQVQLSDKRADADFHEVFVKGLPSTVTEDAVKEHFSNCGSITRIRVPRKGEGGEAKGIAFITFETEEALDKAVELDGKKFGNHSGIMKVDVASNSQSKGKGKGKDKGKGKGKSKGKGNGKKSR